MKKKLFLMACLAVLGVKVTMAQVAVATLHHNDSVTIFSNAQLQAAINKAVDGDTIYLSGGLFAAFSVGKNISIMGSGKSTVISGTVTINGCSSLLLSNMHMTGTLQFQSKVTISGTRILQCVIGDINLNATSTNTDYSSIEMVMCQVTGTLNLGHCLKSLQVVNSKINKVSGRGSNNSAATFVNCNISSLTRSNSGEGNSYENCIIGSNVSEAALKNCLYKTTSGSPQFTDCWNNTEFSLDGDLNCSLTDAELKEKGYIGTDGTVVGITGGSMPFTLVSPILQVTDYTLEPDNVNKKLKVTLKLGNK
ncbi:MAG: hypothetical protein IJ580_01815 [Prevotella sp.]|nr:hypothetical protein [Prevotella sp.]MBR1556723.1 hypothetical protein [Prevotella sp.]